MLISRARPIALMSGVVRGAGRPEPIQQRNHVGLPTITDLCQNNFDVCADGIAGCAAFRRYALHRLAGGQAAGDARLGGG
jgi:hypothetical protein